MYKRFIRWASDRLADDGIVGFITNRAYLETRQDDGFRQVAAQEFTDIYVLDLGSDVRKNPKISGTTHNVFGIQTGVAIGFFVRQKAKLGNCSIHYVCRKDEELATEKLAFLRSATMESIDFDPIVPDTESYWLDQSDSGFDVLLPLANRETKLAKAVSDEKAVFGLHSLGIATNRDEWTYDFDFDALADKVLFFSKVYRDEMQRFAEERPNHSTLGDWVDRSIKWTAELESHLMKGDPVHFATANITRAMYRPFVVKPCYYAPIITHRRYQMPQIFPHDELDANPTINFAARHRSFFALASDRLMDLHFVGDNQCLPLYRYTPDGKRVSNITGWGLRQFCEHYGDDGIGAEDVFAYVYAILHDPVYRQRYEVDLRREFPRVYFQEDFAWWAERGQELFDLHIGFETAEPWPLDREDKAGVTPTRAVLRADKERGVITLDEQTTLAGVPPEAWEYQLGSRSALEWVLDQYKERKPRDPTIRERFNTYRFAGHKERVIDLLGRVCAVSAFTTTIVNELGNRSSIE